MVQISFSLSLVVLRICSEIKIKFIFGFLMKLFEIDTNIEFLKHFLDRHHSANFGYFRELVENECLLIRLSNSTLLVKELHILKYLHILAIFVRSVSKFDSFDFLSTFLKLRNIKLII